MSQKLNHQQIQDKLSNLQGWKLLDSSEVDTIQKQFTFKDYLSGVDFSKQVALKAEELDHHPDILIKYAKVMISISTHDAGGVTEKDFQLAEQIDSLGF